MRKNIFLIVLIFMATGNICFSQNVAINLDATPADPSAMLDVKSTDKGILIPRITQAARTGIAVPAVGLLVYQTDGTQGFYYNEGPGINWKNISKVTAPVGFSAQQTGYTLVGAQGATTIPNWITADPYLTDLGFNTSFGYYVVPKSGVYRLTAVVNYKLSATATVSLPASVNPYFEFINLFQPTPISKSAVPILDINTITVNMRTVLGSASIPMDATIKLNAGEMISMAYVPNGYTGNLTVGGNGEPGIIWSVIKL